MAKVKITGHASGSGVITVTAPNTSTDRTITLPDETATLSTFDPDGAVVINESGADVDFRVESDTVTNALFVNGATGNIGVGTTPESDWYNGYHIIQLGEGSAVGSYVDNSTYLSSNWKDDAANKYINTDEASVFKQSAGKFIFQSAPSGSANAACTLTTKMTIENSGDVLVGTASSFVNQTTRLEVLASATGADALGCKVLGSNDRAISFYQTGYSSPRGHITVGTSSVAYNTSSDYRLKENVVDMENATDRVKQLKPKRFNFIADDTNTLVDGFIAHEVSSVVPEAISGAKDAMKDEEYEVTPAVMDGKIEVTPAVMGTRSVPDMQGIDQSKLVPLLVKTIQELEARITALEA